VNTEERQLSDLLHRLTPEPPRRVTVEDVAFRLANQAGRDSRPPRRRGRIWRRGWAPALAAVSVVAIAGLSVGVAVLASHHGAAPTPGVGASTATSAPASASSSTPSASSPASTTPGMQPLAIDGGPFGAELIDHHTFTQDSLVSGDGSLYAIAPGALDRIDPATGNVVADTPYHSPVPSPPVVLGHTVWVVWSYGGGNVVLHGYDAQTLALVASVLAPATGSVSSTAEGVLAAGPDGNLYVAAGIAVVVVDPAAGQVINRYFLQQGPASSVAISPDGSTMYVGIGAFRLLVYQLGEGRAIEVGSSSLNVDGAGGNLVATKAGVWGTLGIGMTEWVWFAPDGNLSRSARVSQGAGAGLDTVPSLSGGSIWIGGGQTLVCADPATGQVRASASLPTDHGVSEYFSSVAVAGGNAYAYYEDQSAQLNGIVRMTLPSACAG
jgi:hypothetical protein